MRPVKRGRPNGAVIRLSGLVRVLVDVWRPQLSWTHLFMLGALLVAAAVVQVLRPKTFKPKIN